MTIPKKFAFVLMPFNDSFNDIYTYGIKQTCNELGIYCERVDEQIFSERILDRIYNQIAKSDLIIADMTERNANVFYEVGYAHGIGKNVILLTQKSDDIPFDLKHFPHIIYNGEIKTLSKNLKTRIDWFLNEENNNENIDLDFGLEFLVNGKRLENGTEIELKNKKGSWSLGNLKIDVFNSSQKVFNSVFNLGLEIDKDFEQYVLSNNPIKSSTDKLLLNSKKVKEIYPKSYTTIEFPFDTVYTNSKESIVINAVLKIFTKIELREISFKIIIPYDTTFPSF